MIVFDEIVEICAGIFIIRTPTATRQSMTGDLAVEYKRAPPKRALWAPGGSDFLRMRGSTCGELL